MFVRKPFLPSLLYSVMLTVKPGAQWLLQTCGLSSCIQAFKNKTRISHSDEILYFVLSCAFLVFIL